MVSQKDGKIWNGRRVRFDHSTEREIVCTVKMWILSGFDGSHFLRIELQSNHLQAAKQQSLQNFELGGQIPDPTIYFIYLAAFLQLTCN